MGYYVHLHVCFACTVNDGVAALAKKHLSSLVQEEPESQEVKIFLEDLSKRTGMNPGRKGGLSLWGIVGNYTVAESFVEQLIPFWKELLSGKIEGGPCDHERILVFSEREQTEQAIAHEIWLDEVTLELRIKQHECPFAWHQF